MRLGRAVFSMLFSVSEGALCRAVTTLTVELGCWLSRKCIDGKYL
jgi:hypothetical protein